MESRTTAAENVEMKCISREASYDEMSGLKFQQNRWPCNETSRVQLRMESQRREPHQPENNAKLREREKFAL
jgi:hypothetical protein